MQNLLTLRLVADNDEKNHHRHYAVSVGRDLLGDWTVSITYGRTGQRGHEMRYGAANPEAIIAVIRHRLSRRLTATSRIGCSYRLTEISAAPGFDTSAWLPSELMAGFSKAG